ncbi:carnitine 3-dehydrogenase [Rhodospirillaceae bacterium SYSU D60014]|uniref:carnitine 3-dehydrogenase n=1 Tax=Virgifigura deserti TaxID=2268457 RepID=UPI000E65F6EF
MTDVRTAAVIGGGVIGGGWAARLVQNGIDVAVFDPDPEAERKIGEVMANADRAFAKLTNAPQGRKGVLRFVDSVAEAVRDADFIQESAPERIDLKKKLFAEVDAHARPDTLIGSSTSGLLPSDLQSEMRHPERLVVAHPFNPVYLLPLVEIVGGKQTTPETIARAKAFYASIGMKPLHVRKEIDAFIGDRLLEALWREALWLVQDDVATVEEIDDVVRYSFGLRWAQMGTFMVYRIAGGEAGMRHFMAQFGPALKWPWTKLMDVPELTDELVDKIARQSDAQAGQLSIRELERIRDDNLVAILQALRAQNSGKGWGAGEVLKQHEDRLYDNAHRDAADAEHDISQPLRLLDCTVQPDWTDYNGHMTESRYLQVFGDASDALLRFIGIDRDYLAAGHSYYTVETHIMHKSEVAALEPLYVTTQILAADEKRLHVFHRIHHARTDDVIASAEQMLLHVDTKAQKACPAEALVAARVRDLCAAHAALDRPADAGRSVGLRR